MPSRLGQTEAASVILITGIVLALVAVTYFWGTPLINKQTAASDVAIGTRFMRDLGDRLAALANAGTGSFTVAVPLGSFKVVAYDLSDPDANSIILQLPTTAAPLLTSGTIYLDATSYADATGDAGTYGSANHNILSLAAEPFGSGYLVSIRSRERELDTAGLAPRGFLIRLLGPADQQKTAFGKARVTFTVVKSYTDQAAKAANGGDLLVTEVLVSPG